MKNTGKGTESYIEMICDAYESAGIARLRKVDPPTAIVRRGKGPPLVIQKDNPFLDYVGTWTAQNGRALFIEAKSTQEARLPVDRDGGVTAKQFEALKQWEAAGAAVCVLWEYQNDMRLASLHQIKAALADSRASIRWDAAYKIPRGQGFCPHDFLKVLEAIYTCTPV